MSVNFEVSALVEQGKSLQAVTIDKQNKQLKFGCKKCIIKVLSSRLSLLLDFNLLKTKSIFMTLQAFKRLAEYNNRFCMNLHVLKWYMTGRFEPGIP
jgi:hypothetical protein